jgi:hypothetical protein
MARLVVDLPENSPGCILFSGPGVRLPASVGRGAAAGLRPIRSERMRTRVGTLRRPTKNRGAARGMAEGTDPFSSPRPE